MTTVALVHAENFQSFEEIARAKGEIFGHQQTKIGIFPKELKSLFQSLGSCRKHAFSTKDFVFPDPLPSALSGAHHRHNFLAAVAVARTLGVTDKEILSALPRLSLPERRGGIIEKRGIIFINDTYNAATPSVQAALQNLPAGKRHIAVLSEMVELGKFSEQCHKEVAVTALDCVDLLCCIGKGCAPMCRVWNDAGRDVILFEERKSLQAFLEKEIREGDVVLFKGGNCYALWELIDSLNG